MRQKRVFGASGLLVVVDEGHRGDHLKFLCKKEQEGRQITLNKFFKQMQGGIFYFQSATTLLRH